jgi:tetratricopeptide (TPR) repeat protein
VIVETRRALAVSPNFGDAHFVLGAVYFHVGLIDEALAEFKRVEEIAPGEGARYHLGLMALYQGHYEEAAATMERNPNGMLPPSVQSNVAFALFDEGHAQAAQERIDKAWAQHTDEGGVMAATQAVFLAAAGDKVQALQKIDQAIKDGQGFGHFHHTTYAIASAYALLRENDQALKWVTYTADNGFPNLPWFERDPILANLRNDPRFIEFLKGLRPRFERFKELAATPIPTGK